MISQYESIEVISSAHPYPAYAAYYEEMTRLSIDTIKPGVRQGELTKTIILSIVRVVVLLSLMAL